MSGRTARAARQQKRQLGLGMLSVAALRDGMPGPEGYMLRLARPGEAEAVGELTALAGVSEPVLLEAIEKGDLCASVALAALGSDEAGLRKLTEHMMRDDLNGGLQASSVALVATHPQCRGPVGAVLTCPPGNVMKQIQEQGAGLEPLMMLMMGVAKVSAVATHPDHRQVGLGTALLLQATTLAHRVGRTTVYGTTLVPDGLAGWYRRRGFEVREPGAGLDLSWLLARPFGIAALPGEQMFVSTEGRPAKLAR